ncbi:MAG: hypothetical protein ABFS45_27575 [Pseudomonadota bacterium]
MAAARIAAKNTLLENRGTAFASVGLNDIIVEFSETLEGAFSAAVTNPRYIRCTVDNYSISTQLVRIFGIDTLGLNVTAVAGYIHITTCNPAPLMVCGDCGADDVCKIEDDCPYEGDQCFGFNVYKEDADGNPTSPEEKCYLKDCPPGTHCADLEPEVGESCGAQAGGPTGGGESDLSSGNFQFLDMTCESGKTGKNCIKEVFEQGGGVLTTGCPTDGSIVTSEPGNAASIITSFNTIFDGPNPDDHNTYSDILYSQYLPGIQPANNRRRELGIVLADCSSPIVEPGKTDVPVLTVGCFFATDKAVKVAGMPVIWGQFIGQCSGDGEISKTPDAFDTYKIVLYKDHGSPDS